MRVLVFLLFSVGISLAQTPGTWDSGEVRPAGTHNKVVPQLRVQQDWTRYALEYQVRDPAQTTDAWIEVWDRPLVLFRQQVSTGGKLLWEDDTDARPKKLEIALIDPDYKPEYICIDECDPEDLKKTVRLQVSS